MPKEVVMKKGIKVLLIISLVVLGIFLADKGLHLILDAPLRTCKKAYEQMQRADTYIQYYKDDVYKSEKSDFSINWKSVEREFRVEQDEEANTISFYCYNGRGCCGGQYYSKHIFAFDPEGRLTVYCVLYYNDHQSEAYSKATYKISYDQ